MSDYIQELEANLNAARKRATTGTQVKVLKSNAPALFDVIDGEVTLLVNKMTAADPLDRDTYLDIHGQLRGIMRIRDLLNAKEAEADAAIAQTQDVESQLKQMKAERKANGKA